MKDGEVERAQKVFDGMPVRDVAAWNVPLMGYLQKWRVEEVLTVCDRIRRDDVHVGPVAVQY